MSLVLFKSISLMNTTLFVQSTDFIAAVPSISPSPEKTLKGVNHPSLKQVAENAPQNRYRSERSRKGGVTQDFSPQEASLLTSVNYGNDPSRQYFSKSV